MPGAGERCTKYAVYTEPLHHSRVPGAGERRTKYAVYTMKLGLFKQCPNTLPRPLHLYTRALLLSH